MLQGVRVAIKEDVSQFYYSNRIYGLFMFYEPSVVVDDIEDCDDDDDPSFISEYSRVTTPEEHVKTLRVLGELREWEAQVQKARCVHSDAEVYEENGSVICSIGGGSLVLRATPEKFGQYFVDLARQYFAK